MELSQKGPRRRVELREDQLTVRMLISTRGSLKMGVPGRVLAPNQRHERRVPPDVCCARMAEALVQACGQHDDPFECPDNLIYWSSPLDEYGLIVHDGSEATC